MRCRLSYPFPLSLLTQQSQNMSTHRHKPYSGSANNNSTINKLPEQSTSSGNPLFVIVSPVGLLLHRVGGINGRPPTPSTVCHKKTHRCLPIVIVIRSRRSVPIFHLFLSLDRNIFFLQAFSASCWLKAITSSGHHASCCRQRSLAREVVIFESRQPAEPSCCVDEGS